MKTNCPNCGRSKCKKLSSKEGEQIVRCDCGVVYKNIVRRDIIRHYGNPHIWDNPFFKERYKKISKYLAEKVKKPERIIDIGCADGRMLEQLHNCFSDSILCGVEPSKPLHASLSNYGFKINVIKSSFDDCEIKEKFDLVVCMGVDYLFVDHNKGMIKLLNILKSTGCLYIERNVFYDMQSFVGKKIKNTDDMFWTNRLITTWYTVKQMETQLEKHFEIKDKLIYGEEHSKQVGWLCISKNNTN